MMQSQIKLSFTTKYLFAIKSSSFHRELLQPCCIMQQTTFINFLEYTKGSSEPLQSWDLVNKDLLIIITGIK